MNCPQCKTENPEENKYCKNCGGILTAGATAVHSSQQVFSDKEVQELLSINRETIKSGGKQQTITQQDIDKLFE